MEIKKLYIVIFVAIFVATFISCKPKGCMDSKATNYDPKAKKDDGTCTLPKTSQDCMNENGPGFFANSSGQCEWTQALSVSSDISHWSGGCQFCWFPGGYNSIKIQFIRDGSNTSGTGKTKCCNGTGSVGTFTWKMDPYNAKTIIILSGDNIFNSNNPFSLVTLINPNSGSNPTSFTANVTRPEGTVSMSFNMLSGAL